MSTMTHITIATNQGFTQVARGIVNGWFWRGWCRCRRRVISIPVRMNNDTARLQNIKELVERIVKLGLSISYAGLAQIIICSSGKC